MLEQLTLWDTDSAIFALASVDGLSPSVLQGFQTTPPHGLSAFPAPTTPSLATLTAERKARQVAAISGRFTYVSTGSAALQSLLESRLQALFHGHGGMKSPWILKKKTTPLGRSFSELMPSERSTSGGASAGWPTPAARDWKDLGKSGAFPSQLARHSPSMASLLLSRGVHWTAVSTGYCLAMGYPSSWNEALSRVTETR